jgi:4-hydroxymandelate oxidase
MCIPTLDLDLSVELFGQQHFAPILVGPVADQRRYHAEGELATVRGASAARAAVVVSSRSSESISEVAAHTKTPLWYAVDADADSGAQKDAHRAVAAGCTTVCITIGASDAGKRLARARVDWKAIDEIRRGLDVPIVIKGVMDARVAAEAIEHGVRGIVVSNHGALPAGGNAPIEIVSSIADAVGGRAALLVDGSFRRGTDILKALVLGAQAVLVARPVMWALAGYGAEGVQTLIEMLQTDVARQMGALGASNLATLTRSMVKVHSR